MPFKSKKQMKFFAAAKERGEISPETFKKFSDHTPNKKALPEKAPKKKEKGK